jgi:hypothetical protein
MEVSLQGQMSEWNSYWVAIHPHSVEVDHLHIPAWVVPQTLHLVHLHHAVFQDEDPIQSLLMVVLLVDTQLVLFFLESENLVIGSVEDPGYFALDFMEEFGIDRRKLDKADIEVGSESITSEDVGTHEVHLRLKGKGRE